MGDTFKVAATEMIGESWKLRRLVIEDAPAFFAYASKPEVARYTLWPSTVTAEFAGQFITAITSAFCISWGIVPAGQMEMAGMVFLHSFNARHRRAELSFNLNPAFQGQGLATAAARQVIAFAFNRLELHRLEATIMPGNVASRRVVEKLGFQFEGLMRQSHCRPDGFHDMQLFSLLRADVPSLERS